MPTSDILTVARSTGAATTRAYIVVPASRAVGLVAGPLEQIARRLSSARLVRRVPDWLPEGPDASTRRSARMAVLAEVVGPGGVGRAWAHGRDLYGTTARLVVAVARRLHEADDPPAGVRTPSQVADPAAEPSDQAGELLDDAGMAWSEL